MPLLVPIQFAPGEKLPILFPWGDWCTAEGVSIDTYVVTPEAGLTLVDHSQAGNDITAWVELADPDTPVGTRLELSCAVVGTGTPARRGVRTGLIVVTKLGGPNA